MIQFSYRFFNVSSNYNCLGSLKGNTFYNIVIGSVLGGASKRTKTCQLPKPILLATGEARFPHHWSPTVVETQVFRIGQLLLPAVPGEFTTMSGRRLRKALSKVFIHVLLFQGYYNYNACLLYTSPSPRD